MSNVNCVTWKKSDGKLFKYLALTRGLFTYSGSTIWPKTKVDSYLADAKGAVAPR